MESIKKRLLVGVAALLLATVMAVMPIIGMVITKPEDIAELQKYPYRYKIMVSLSMRETSVGHDRISTVKKGYLTFPPVNLIRVKHISHNNYSLPLESHESKYLAYQILCCYVAVFAVAINFVYKHKKR